MSRRPSLWAERDRADDAAEGAFSSARWRAQAERERERRRPPAPDGEPAPATDGRRRRLAPLQLATLVLALIAVVLGTVALVSGGNEGAPSPEAALAPTGGKLPATIAGRVYRSAGEGVVSVRAGSGSGTGFVVDADGTIVTNAHVVGENDQVLVRFHDNDRQVDAEVLGMDASSDLAVLKVDPADSGALRPLPLADSDDVQVGDAVLAIGHPFGLDRTATAGIVSGVGREIQAPDGFQIDEAIQTDAPINPGNSGGPLLDARGRVIGVNSQIRGGAGGGNVGIGFAVPSNTVREVLPRLRRGQTIERPWLGVATAPDPSGAAVQEVVPGSPAAQAGVEVGDVITSVDGKPVREPNDVAEAIQDLEPGDTVSVGVDRGAGERSFDVELRNRPQRVP
jgi:putative serine protease PepD